MLILGLGAGGADGGLFRNAPLGLLVILCSSNAAWRNCADAKAITDLRAVWTHRRNGAHTAFAVEDRIVGTGGRRLRHTDTASGFEIIGRAGRLGGVNADVALGLRVSRTTRKLRCDADTILEDSAWTALRLGGRDTLAILVRRAFRAGWKTQDAVFTVKIGARRTAFNLSGGFVGQGQNLINGVSRGLQHLLLRMRSLKGKEEDQGQPNLRFGHGGQGSQTQLGVIVSDQRVRRCGSREAL